MVASAMVFRVNVANKQNSQLILDDISGTESNSGAIFEVSESFRMFHNVSEGQRVSHNRSQSISKHFIASKSILKHLRMSQNFSEHVRGTQSITMHLGASQSITEHSETLRVSLICSKRLCYTLSSSETL